MPLSLHWGESKPDYFLLQPLMLGQVTVLLPDILQEVVNPVLRHLEEGGLVLN